MSDSQPKDAATASRILPVLQCFYSVTRHHGAREEVNGKTQLNLVVRPVWNFADFTPEAVRVDYYAKPSGSGPNGSTMCYALPTERRDMPLEQSP